MDFVYKHDGGFGLQDSLSLEWLETNGLGGYASSTISGSNSRKYHGLLVSDFAELAERYVALSKVEDFLLVGTEKYCLSASQFPGYLDDGSFEFLQEFAVTTHPQVIYKFPKATISKEILMPYLEDTILIKYKLLAGTKANLQIRPLFAWRIFHNLCKENNDVQDYIEECHNGLGFRMYPDLPLLFLQCSQNFEFTKDGVWYRDFEYLEELKRGYDFHEDLFTPGQITLELSKTKELIFSCSLTENKDDLANKWNNEIKRRQQLAQKFSGTKLQQHLQKVSQVFIKHDSNHNPESIIAGYHWFDAWGRDAMIALPGITLSTNNSETCLTILRHYAVNEHAGLIPNFLGATKDTNAYNSVDASLWFAWATQQYYLKTQDFAGVKQHLWPTLINIFTNYRDGTINNINMHADGLIYAGDADANLSWMDAMVNDEPATPRFGALVEINALWFNMLMFMYELAQQFSDDIQYELLTLQKRVKSSFNQIFWNDKLGYLYDYITETYANAQIRPNQVFAVSLPYSPLDKTKATKVMEVVTEHLLTPYGLRTLAPSDLDYHKTYAGSSQERDAAYHNGTVWPWLIGHYAEAALKVLPKQKIVFKLKKCVKVLENSLFADGIGCINEIFDAETPHYANGCIQQAWSVAEFLRLTLLVNFDKEK